tara:strand:- start:486 stop:659 length:174 start_codon:yes stop_codon:yes gene_type:complete
MYEAPINLSEDTPSDLLARIMTYIGAAFRFQRNWALPAQAGNRSAFWRSNAAHSRAW